LFQFQCNGVKEPASFTQFDYDKLLARLCAKGIINLKLETLALGNGRFAFSGKQVSPHFEIFIFLMAVYNERHYLLIFDVVPALHLKQSKRQVVLELSTDNIDHPFTNKDDASNVVRPSWVGELIVDTLINEEIIAARLNRNTALSKAFVECLAHKSITIHSLGDNAC